jgi:hypothetical protein
MTSTIQPLFCPKPQPTINTPVSSYSCKNYTNRFRKRKCWLARLARCLRLLRESQTLVMNEEPQKDEKDDEDVTPRDVADM